MQLTVVSNRGPNRLIDYLRGSLRGATRADFAVAFASFQGVSEILDALPRVARRDGVNILTGIYQDVTEPRVLRALLRARKGTGGKFSVRLSKDLRFHQKLFLIRKVARVVAVIGSSNLTAGGLKENREPCAAFHVRPNSYDARRLEEAFRDEWRNAVPLEEERIRLYEKRYEALRKAQEIRRVPPHRTILKDGPEPPEAEQDVKFWRESCLYEISEDAGKEVEDKTGWDMLGYDWQSVSPHAMRRKDRLLVLDFLNETAQLAEIKDQEEIGTRDGRYFIAYKQLRGSHPCRVGNKLWQRFRQIGVVTTQADAKRRRRPISARMWVELLKVFRKPRG
jgi:HKD family nuclease